MNNKIIKLSVLAFGLTMGLQGAVAYADDCNKPEYQALLKIKAPDVLHRINELNLTQTQKDQFKTLKNNFDAESKKSMDSLKSIAKQTEQIITTPTIDRARLDSLLLDWKNNVIARYPQSVVFRHNLYNLLNDTQKAKYHELQQQERQYFQMSLQCPDIAKKLPLNIDPYDHINELNLTDEQKTKIMPLIQSYRDQTTKLLRQFDDSDMSYNQVEKQIVQSASPIDSEKLNDFATAQADSVEVEQKNSIMTAHEIYEILNAKQQAQFMKIWKNPLAKQ